MQVSPVDPLLPLQPEKPGSKQEPGGGSFSDLLNQAIEKLNASELKADNLATGLLTGELQDIHQVTVAMQEAKLTMQLAVEVRNKVVEAYQEISRIQV